MSTFLKSITRRKRRIRRTVNDIKYNQLQYLGSGSYGSVYAIYDTNIALKEHRIFTMDDDALCQNWKQEYEIQKAVFNLTNSKLKQLHVGIVEPFAFSYAMRDKDNMLVPQSDIKNASSCFFTMERVDGYASTSYNTCFTRKLYSILKPTAKLLPATIPPYLYLGSLHALDGHITLDMLQGTHLIEFPNESFNYCIIDGIAFHILKSMFLSFFILVDSGFIPRDIEFVFNGGCHNTYISILDFNEVKTILERKYGRDSYNLDIDVAHVYIDLCGLRSSRDVNPQAPYDSPTPQWKFLCSPIISPYAFFKCVDAANMYGFRVCTIDRVISEILLYIEKRCFSPFFERTPPHIRSLWYPRQPEFSNTYTDFDSKLQLYYIYGLFETIERRKLPYPEIQYMWTYTQILSVLQSVILSSNSNICTMNDSNEWDSLWMSADPEIQKSTNMILRKRRYTSRRHPQHTK